MALLGHLSLLFTLVLLSLFPSPSYPSAVLGPDLTTCLTPTGIADEESSLNCCAPASSSPPSPYYLNYSDLTNLRVRRPSHAVDQTYFEKLARGYNLMRALPPEDPRSFHQQANIHCAYCNVAYNQLNSSKEFQIHSSWLFCPFHRWYLYFHERILAKLLGDDTFALTFWNYDHPDGCTMPWMFTNVPDLVDEFRDPLHQPPSVVAIDFSYSTDARSREKQINANANTMYRTMIRAARTPFQFFGKPYRHGDDKSPGSGSLEQSPHNTVHLWTGHRSKAMWKDMGNFYAAARDPIFYSHHSNLDRLWEVWKSFEGNEDMDDPDYLDSEFAFYDENAELVSVKVRDALNITKMGYAYEDVENLWVNVTLVRQSSGVATLSSNNSLCTPGEPILVPCSATVQRDPEVASMGFEEDLLIIGINWVLGATTQFSIYINLPTADLNTTTGCLEYVGGLSITPHLSPGLNETSLNFDITEILSDLNLMNESSIIVTIVPMGLYQFASPVAIDDFGIDYSERPRPVGNRNDHDGSLHRTTGQDYFSTR